MSGARSRDCRGEDVALAPADEGVGEMAPTARLATCAHVVIGHDGPVVPQVLSELHLLREEARLVRCVGILHWPSLRDQYQVLVLFKGDVVHLHGLSGRGDVIRALGTAIPAEDGWPVHRLIGLVDDRRGPAELAGLVGSRVGPGGDIEGQQVRREVLVRPDEGVAVEVPLALVGVPPPAGTR